MTDDRRRECMVPGCEKPRHRRSRLCSMHRTRLEQHGMLEPPRVRAPAWTPAQDRAIVSWQGTDAALAERLGRTVGAVRTRRNRVRRRQWNGLDYGQDNAPP